MAVKIEKDTIIGDVLDVAPQAAPLFFAIGMHCLGCPSSRGETVEEACMVHGIDCEPFLAQLNHFLEAYEADQANNRGRMEEMIRGQLGKTSGHYSFRLTEIHAGESLPFMSASFLNTIRRDSAETLDGMPCKCKDILTRDIQQAGQIGPTVKDVTYKHNVSNHISTEVYTRAGGESIEKAFELIPRPDAELMRTKYCIRYELGICPVHHKARNVRPLFLVNNGRRLALNFDCRNCEMTVTATVTEIRQS